MTGVPPTTGEPVGERVRRRLRELRAERGLTLEAVAARASIDVSTLSRLESGKRRLALDHLPALAAALGITADDLLSPRRPVDPRVRRPPQRFEGLTMWPLTRYGGPGGLHVFRLRIDAARSVPPDPLPVHEGHDWLYVVSGRLRLLLGEDDLAIEPGEAVEFSTWTPHWFGAADGAVEALAIFGPQGAGVHLHD
ncbi:MAG TPA: XRE family transcriptional regulator [Solirubrobacteraceae bacterium]|nr:XRE family transcriptional regulator [Solirubrobacteraceae bacterium]